MLSLRPTQEALGRKGPDFELYKPLIEHWYLGEDKTLKEVRGLMSEKYGFQATKYQYEKAFDGWRWTKNIPGQVWDQICFRLQHLQLTGYNYDVFYYTEKMSQRQVCQAMKKRSKQVLRVLHPQAASTLPPGVAILQPPLDLNPVLLKEIPFHCFEHSISFDDFTAPTKNYFDDHMDVESDRMLALTCPTSDVLDKPRISQLSKSTLKENQLRALKAVVVPSHRAGQVLGVTDNRSDLHLYSSTLHRHILFSLANNFAGLDDFTIEQVVQFLQGETSQKLVQSISQAHDCYSKHAIILNLFRAAMHIGDQNLGRFIWQHKSARKYVDAFIQHNSGGSWTPLKFEQENSIKGFVRIALDYKAVMKMMESDEIAKTGALRPTVHLVTPWWEKSLLVEPNIDIRAILPEAGSQVPGETLISLVKDQKHDLLKRLVKERDYIHAATWREAEVFRSVMSLLDNSSRSEIIDIISFQGQYLDNTLTDRHHNGPAMRMMNIAASAGLVEVVRILLSKGSFVSKDTFHYAAYGGYEDVVRLLLTSKHPVLDEEQYMDSLPYWSKRELDSPQDLGTQDNCVERANQLLPLAFQFGKMGSCIMKHLFETGSLQHLITQPFSESALGTAITSGSAATIQFLEDHGFAVDDEDINNALIMAAHDGEEEGARLLLAMGANVDTKIYLKKRGSHYHGPALIEAIKGRNPALVNLFLEAGAYPDCLGSFNGKPSTAIELAVYSSHHQIVQQLVNAGCNLDYRGSSKCRTTKPALAAAVQNSDLSMLELLILEGASINEPKWWKVEDEPVWNLGDRTVLLSPIRESLLSIAVKTGNIDIVKCLLDHGADPADEYALAQAAITGWTFCDLLLSRHRDRYPQGFKNFGGWALGQAIELRDYNMFVRLLERKLDACSKIFALPEDEDGDESWCSPFALAIWAAGEDEPKYLEKILSQKYSPEANVLFATDEETGTGIITAFGLAATEGNVSAVKCFIKHDACVDFMTNPTVPMSPVQIAALSGHLEIVQLLINAGADINKPAARRDGSTALQGAAFTGCNAIVNLLLSYGADVDAAGAKGEGRTALEAAASNGRLDTVKILLNAGAANHGKDRAQIEKAASYALKEGFPYIRDMLYDYLASKEPELMSQTIKAIEEDSMDVITTIEKTSMEFTLDVEEISMVLTTEEVPVNDFFDWNRWDENAIKID